MQVSVKTAELASDLGSTSDAELLASYAAGHSQEAFAQIVARHGPMVWRTCLRMTGNPPDAEDAFQATFVVLTQRPGAVKPGLSVWLYGMARHTAGHLVRSRTRRGRHEREAARRRAADAEPNLMGPLREELDAALAKLPAAQREAVILRYLEGQTQEEAARRVGCEQSALAKRAAAGLERLRILLQRRGSVCSLAMLGVLLTKEASAAVPQSLQAAAALGTAASSSANSLAQTVLQSRRLWMRRMALAVLAVGLVGLGIFLLAGRKRSPSTSSAAAWVPLATVEGHYAPVTCLAFSPDGNLLASGSLDKTIQLWDVARQRTRYTLRGHEKGVGVVLFSPDGQALGSTSWDRTVRLWEVAAGVERKRLPVHSGYCYALVFSPDSKELHRFTWSGGMSFLNPATGQVVVNPDPDSLGTASVQCMALSPDHKKLALALSRNLAIRDLGTGKDRVLVKQGIGNSSDVYHVVAFSPDGTTLAAGARNGKVRLWDLKTAKQQQVWQRTDKPRAEKQWPLSVISMQFAPDGRSVAAGMADGTILIWDRPFGQLRATLHQAIEVSALAFSVDGRTLASADGNQIKLWKFQASADLQRPAR